jgi:hypothetical protein
VRHCLEKNPEERFHSAIDLAFAIEALSGTTPTSVQTGTMPALGPRWMKRRELLAWIVASAAVLATLALALAYLERTRVDVRAVRSFILPPEKSTFNFGRGTGASISLSPDGRRLAFVAATAGGGNLLWVRSLDALSAQALAGTEGATYPFWSPEEPFRRVFCAGQAQKNRRCRRTGTHVVRRASGSWRHLEPKRGDRFSPLIFPVHYTGYPPRAALQARSLTSMRRKVMYPIAGPRSCLTARTLFM